ncbi:MAG: hypothetical protein QNL90_18990 [Gammaproteobacteria bacterium]|jgi:hypothetical protein|nr:hypothetical protein [Gammaproteobacteria bacterium]MDX2462220.1 hypothetical protein [Gammaproteobacteria bacterium]
MMPCGPLADDWLFWDPETISTYPHSDAPREAPPELQEVPIDAREPRQLNLFATYP